MTRETKRSTSDASAFRLGSAALGLLCGIVIGLLCACVGIYLFDKNLSFARLVFGFAAIGMLIGVVYPEDAWALAEGTVHFLFGLSTAAGENIISPSTNAPVWLKVLLWLGVAAGALALFG